MPIWVFVERELDLRTIELEEKELSICSSCSGLFGGLLFARRYWHVSRGSWRLVITG
jgi:hypothetical protein